MNYLLSIILLLVLNSCVTSHRVTDDRLEMSIEEAHSYVYDLNHQTLTVRRISRPDTIIHFQLSVNERSQIINKYYELELDKIKGKTVLDDSCWIMPEIYTTLIVRSNKKLQKIAIDKGCYINERRISNKGKILLIFLNFTDSILKQKPEIKKAPQSDMIYM